MILRATHDFLKKRVLKFVFQARNSRKQNYTSKTFKFVAKTNLTLPVGVEEERKIRYFRV